MSVNWIQAWTWGPLASPGGEQTHHFRIPFRDHPHIIATAYLNATSSADVDEVVGAMATFRSFEFLDEEGFVREVVQPSPSAFVEVQRCVSVTLEYVIRVAWAEAGWTIYYLS